MNSNNTNDVWDGTSAFVFSRVSNHTNTIRYQCPLAERVFDLYASRAHVENSTQQQSPDDVVVVLRPGRRCLGRIGFSQETTPTFQDHIGEIMTQYDVKSGTVQYRSLASSEAEPWRIYVPHEVFQGARAPEHLSVGVLLREGT